MQLAESAAAYNAGQLTVDLVWHAVQDITVDYTYFLHLRPADDAMPVTQADGQPLDGLYPTSLWEAGEVVPLAITLDDLPTVPGTYDLVVGWYIAPDGPRLMLDGDDSLFLARLIIGVDGSVSVD